MRTLWTVVAAMAVILAGCSEQKTGIAAAADAMGATNLNTIEYSGSGSLFGFGQAFLPGDIAIVIGDEDIAWLQVLHQFIGTGISQKGMGRVLDIPRMAERRNLSRRISAPWRWSAANSPGRKPATKRTPIRARSAIACARCGRRPKA